MNHMPASVPQIDSGTVTAAATVGISRRMNSSTTSSTRAMVISRVYCTSATLARIVVVRSEMTVSLMSGGSQLISCGSSVLDAVDRSMTLAPASLVMVSRIAGCLPFQAARRVLATPSITRGDVGQPQHRAVAGLEHQRRVVRGLRDLAVDADRSRRGPGPGSRRSAASTLAAADRVVDVLRRPARRRPAAPDRAARAPPASRRRSR